MASAVPSTGTPKLGGSGAKAPAAKAPTGDTSVLSGTRLILSVYARFHERLAGLVSTKLKDAPPESFEKGGKIKTIELARTITTKAFPPRDEKGVKSWQWFPRDSPHYGPGIYTLVQTAKQVTIEKAADTATNAEAPKDGGHSAATDVEASTESSETVPATASTAPVNGAPAPVPGQIDGLVLLIKLLFEWVPQRKLSEAATTLLITQEAAPTEIESKFSFTAFASRIYNLKLSEQKQMDLVEAVVLLVIADILYLALKIYSADKYLDIKTIEKLAQLCLLLSRPTKPRALDIQVWSALNSTICIQYANVLGQLSRYILPMMTSFVSIDMNKLPNDIQLAALSALRLRFDGEYWYSKESDTMSLMTAYMIQFMKEKTVAFRIAQIEVLDAWLLTLDMSAGGPVFDLIKQQVKTIEKALKGEDTEPAATRLITTVIAHGATSYLEKNVDVHVSKTLLKNVWNIKKKDYCLECILRILRGNYTSSQVCFEETGMLDWLPPPPEGVSFLEASSQILPPYAFAGLAFDEDKMVSRLITINSGLFGQKSVLPKIELSVDICAEIVLQMCCHSIKFGISTVLPQLLSGPTQHRLIGVRALKRLLDPEFGFLTHAYCLRKHIAAGEEAPLNAESVRLMLTESVTSILAQCAAQLHRDSKEVSKYSYEGLARQFTSPCAHVGPLLGTFKNLQMASEQLKASLDRMKFLLNSDPSGATRWNMKELEQSDVFVEERAKRWCGLSEVPYPGNRIFVGQNRVDDEATGPATGSTASGPILGGAAASVVGGAAAGSGVAGAAAGPGAAPATPVLEGKKWKKKLLTPEKMAMHELAREAAQCIEFLMPTQFLLKPDDFVMGSLLVHYDSDISNAASRALQALVLRNQDLRVPIIRQLLQLVLHYSSCQAPLYSPGLGTEEHNVYALLSELLILLDLWALATFQEQLPTNQQPTEVSGLQKLRQTTPIWSIAQAASLLDEIEAVAFVTLADPFPFTRSTALSILGAVEALREQFSLLDHNRGLTWLMRAHGTSVMQKVRYEYVLDAAQGMADQVTIPSDKMLLKIEHVAASTHDTLWSYILSQLAYTIIDNQEVMGIGSNNVLRIARTILSHRVDTWRSIAQSNGTITGANNPPSLTFAAIASAPTALMGASAFAFSSSPANLLQVAGSSSTPEHFALPVLFRNVHTLLFSMSASVPNSSVPMTLNFEEAAAQASVRIEDTTKSEEYAIQSSLAGYLAFFFRNLQYSDDPAMMQSLIFAAGRVHWRSISVLLGVLWYRYYLALSSKRVSQKRTKTRPEIAHILRRVTQHSQFKDALRLDTQGALPDNTASGQIPLPPTSVAGQLLLSRICLHFIEETNTIFNSTLAKTPSIQISEYYTANIVVLANFLTAAEALNRLGAADAIICPQIGPLRHFLSPTANRSPLESILRSTLSQTALEESESSLSASVASVSSLSNSSNLSNSVNAAASNTLPMLRAILGANATSPPLLLAAPDWREIGELLLSYSGLGKRSEIRKAADAAEAGRFLARYKDGPKKDTKKIQFDAIVTTLNAVSMSGIEQLARLGVVLDQATANDQREMRKILVEWVMQAERAFDAHLLRWLLASYYSSLWEIYIEKCFSKNSRESALFANAVYDQFLDSSATSVGSEPPQYGVTESTTKFFNYMVGVHKERLRLERAALRKEDREFAKVVATNGGALLFIVLIQLQHASHSVRKRSFELLYRLAPIAWGAGQVPSDTTSAKRLNQKRDAYLNRLAEGIAPSEDALEVSSLVSELCALFAEDVFREAFKRYESLTNVQRHWAIQVLTCWTDNILLTGIHNRPSADDEDNERQTAAQPLRTLKPVSFLEQLFSLYTVNLAVEPYTQTPLHDIWLRLAAISPMNLKLVVDFLLSKAAAPVPRADISKTISRALLLELYRSQPVPTLKHTTNCLTMAAILNANANTTAGTNTLSKSPDVVEVDPNLLRDAVIGILADFAVDNVEPLLPHLHIIFNYVLMKIDTTEVTSSLSTLLRCVVGSLRHLILTRDSKRARYLTKTNGVLEGILDLLQHHVLKLEWCFERSAAQSDTSAPSASNQSGYGSTSNSTFRSMTRAKLPTPTQSVSSAGTSIRVTLRRTGAQALVEWATTGLLPSLLVGILCQAAFWADPDQQRDIRARWAEEALQWMRQSQGSTELVTMSTKAVEVVSALLAEEDDEEAAREGDAPNALLPDHSVLAKLRTTLFESILHLDRAQRSNIPALHQFGGATELRRQHQQQESINVLRARTSELLDMFIKISTLIKEETTVLEMLWVAVSLLRLSPVTFSNFFEKALLIVDQLVSSSSFLKLHSSSMLYQKHIKRAQTWGFHGLFPLLLKSLYSPRTERIGVNLLLHLVELESKKETRVELFPLLGLRPDHGSAALLLICLLPWIYSTLAIAYAAPQTVAAKDRETALDLLSTVCDAFTKNFEASPKLAAEIGSEVVSTIELLSKASKSSQSDAIGASLNVPHPEAFIRLVVRSVGNLSTPPVSDYVALLDSVLLEGPIKFVEAVMKVMSEFISSLPQAQLAVLAQGEHISNVITEATYRAATVVSSPAEIAALELLNKLSLRAVPVNVSNGVGGMALEPLLRGAAVITNAAEQRTLRPAIEALQPDDVKSVVGAKEKKGRKKTKGHASNFTMVEKPDLKRLRTKRSKKGGVAHSKSPDDPALTRRQLPHQRSETRSKPGSEDKLSTGSSGGSGHRRMRSASNAPSPAELDAAKRSGSPSTGEAGPMSNSPSTGSVTSQTKSQTSSPSNTFRIGINFADPASLILSDEEIDELIDGLESLNQLDEIRRFLSSSDHDEEDEDSSSSNSDSDDDSSSGSGSDSSSSSDDEEVETPSAADMAYLAGFDLEGIDFSAFQPSLTREAPEEPVVVSANVATAKQKGGDAVVAEMKVSEAKSSTAGPVAKDSSKNALNEGKSAADDLLNFDTDSIEKALMGLKGLGSDEAPPGGSEKTPLKKKKRAPSRTRTSANSSSSSITGKKKKKKKKGDDDSDDSDDKGESEDEGRGRAATVAAPSTSSSKSKRESKASQDDSAPAPSSSKTSKLKKERQSMTFSSPPVGDETAASSSSKAPGSYIPRNTSQKLKLMQQQIASGSLAGDSSTAEVEKIMNNTKQRARLLEFVTKNNYNKEHVLFLEAIYEFKKEKDFSRAASKAKRIMDRYFPKKASLALLSDIPDTIRQEILHSYEAISPGTPPVTFFAKPELFVVNHIAKNFMPMFLKSDIYKATD